VSTVARLGSFRRAADELHISQPALSETVRNLERELGVDIFERGRSGVSLSEAGRQVLPHIAAVIEAVDGLRAAADEHHQISRMIRVATVNAATVALLTSTMAAFRVSHPATQVEVVGAQEEQIDRGLREGSVEIGLITCLSGDDMPPEFETTRLLRGRAIVCIRPDSALATKDEISPDDLLEVPLIMMRAGYLMHRFLHRILAGRAPMTSYSTDGGDMGKLMVAEGLGATVLPDFTVIGDPLERSGAITWRPLVGDHPVVEFAVRRRRSGSRTQAARDIHRLFIEHAQVYEAERQRPVALAGQ
jgi:DNA-binding transcriptional LysR family regulator